VSKDADHVLIGDAIDDQPVRLGADSNGCGAQLPRMSQLPRNADSRWPQAVLPLVSARFSRPWELQRQLACLPSACCGGREVTPDARRAGTSSRPAPRTPDIDQRIMQCLGGV